MHAQGIAIALAAAADGDENGWLALMERFNGLLWSIARAHRLGACDAEDVVQVTWMRLVEHIDRIDSPHSVGAWLATTARRECQRHLRHSGRQQLSGFNEEWVEEPSVETSPEGSLLATERGLLLRQALDEVPDRCQRLLRVLMASPPPSYAEAAAALDVPIGSIGPTRARCLNCLRRALSRLEEPSSAARR